MVINEKFAHSKDSAVDLTAKGISGKSQQWFNEQFIIAGNYVQPSISLSFSGGSTVEPGTALSTSNTVAITFTKNDSGGVNTSGTKSFAFTPAGGSKSSKTATCTVNSGQSATGASCALTMTSPLSGTFKRGSNVIEVTIAYLAGTASKNFRLANDAKTDTGVADTANAIKASTLTKSITVTGALKIFYSSALAKGVPSASTAPSSATIRAWTSMNESNRSLTLTPSTSYGAVAFAVPSNISVSKITNANNQNVTSAFSSRAVSITLPDSTTEAYTLYYYEAANSKFGANDTYSVTLS